MLDSSQVRFAKWVHMNPDAIHMYEGAQNKDNQLAQGVVREVITGSVDDGMILEKSAKISDGGSVNHGFSRVVQSHGFFVQLHCEQRQIAYLMCDTAFNEMERSDFSGYFVNVKCDDFR